MAASRRPVYQPSRRWTNPPARDRLPSRRRRRREAATGTRVRATRSEQARAKTTTRARAWKSAPVVVRAKTTGRKMTQVVSVEATIDGPVGDATGALASRDWRPMHHDKDFAQNQGVENIFMNTPNQAAWFERYLTDWTGPLTGRSSRTSQR